MVVILELLVILLVTWVVLLWGVVWFHRTSLVVFLPFLSYGIRGLVARCTSAYAIYILLV